MIQEVVLPPKAIVICGGFSVPWEDLVLACRMQVGNLREGDVHDTVIFVNGLRTEYQELQRKKTLMELIFRCYGFLSTDPRDKLFAMLGLASDGNYPDLAPDYSQNTQEIFMGGFCH